MWKTPRHALPSVVVGRFTSVTDSRRKGFVGRQVGLSVRRDVVDDDDDDDVGIGRIMCVWM